MTAEGVHTSKDGGYNDQSIWVGLREELEYLRDLFERRLLNDRMARQTIDVLQDQLSSANAALEAQWLLPIVYEVLAVCDRLNRADAVSDHNSDAARVTMDELLEILYRRGLREVEWQGPFDSRIHESVAFVETPGRFREVTNIELERPGYWLGDRLVRPARVMVSGPSSEPIKNDSNVKQPAGSGDAPRDERSRLTDESTL